MVNGVDLLAIAAVITLTIIILRLAAQLDRYEKRLDDRYKTENYPPMSIRELTQRPYDQENP